MWYRCPILIPQFQAVWMEPWGRAPRSPCGHMGVSSASACSVHGDESRSSPLTGYHTVLLGERRKTHPPQWMGGVTQWTRIWLTCRRSQLSPLEGSQVEEDVEDSCMMETPDSCYWPEQMCSESSLAATWSLSSKSDKVFLKNENWKAMPTFCATSSCLFLYAGSPGLS